jgi:hypothetical protein
MSAAFWLLGPAFGRTPDVFTRGAEKFLHSQTAAAAGRMPPMDPRLSQPGPLGQAWQTNYTNLHGQPTPPPGNPMEQAWHANMTNLQGVGAGGTWQANPMGEAWQAVLGSVQGQGQGTYYPPQAAEHTSRAGQPHTFHTGPGTGPEAAGGLNGLVNRVVDSMTVRFDKLVAAAERQMDQWIQHSPLMPRMPVIPGVTDAPGAQASGQNWGATPAGGPAHTYAPGTTNSAWTPQQGGFPMGVPPMGMPSMGMMGGMGMGGMGMMGMGGMGMGGMGMGGHHGMMPPMMPPMMPFPDLDMGYGSTSPSDYGSNHYHRDGADGASEPTHMDHPTTMCGDPQVCPT